MLRKFFTFLIILTLTFQSFSFAEDEVEKIDGGKIYDRVEREGYLTRYRNGDNLYSQSSVEFLHEKNLITDAEYDVLKKYEPTLIYMLKVGLTQIYTQSGQTAGSDEALKDYVVSTINLFNPLEFKDLVVGLVNLDLDKLGDEFKEIVDIYRNKDEIFEGLSDYDKSYYEGYLTTTFELAIIPIKLNKANKLKLKKETVVMKKIILLNKSSKLWTATKDLSSLENAYKHWLDHGKEFPLLQNSIDYVKYAKEFVTNPPSGTLEKIRANGDTLFYNQELNIFSVKTKDGIPRTIFKPTTEMHGYNTNLEYFNSL